MKVAMLVTDGRECYRDYGKADPYFGPAQDALFQGMAHMPNMEVHVVSCWQRPLPAPAKLAPNIWFHGLVVPKIGWMRTGYQGCIRSVRKKVRELQADIVHAQGTEREGGMSAVFSGVRNVITIHGNMEAIAKVLRARIGSYEWCAGKLETFTLKRTGGVLCNSRYTEMLVKPRAKRTWPVANPIREEFFDSVPELKRSEKPILVNVGVISPRKRQLEILDMAAELRRRGVNCELQFIGRIGQDSYGRAFMERIKPAESAGYARYIGVKPVLELVKCFDQASAMIHFPTEEAFGLVVAEGLARNLKFFGSRTGGIVDIASKLDGVELFGEEDWNGLTNSIAEWISRGAPMPADAASAIQRRYHPAVIANAHLNVYQEIMKIP